MRTWRLFSVFAVLALVLAACGQQGASPSEAAGESEPITARPEHRAAGYSH